MMYYQPLKFAATAVQTVLSEQGVVEKFIPVDRFFDACKKPMEMGGNYLRRMRLPLADPIADARGIYPNYDGSKDGLPIEDQ